VEEDKMADYGENTIELGQAAKDKVTGFEGILTGHADYIYGCDQYLITAKSEKGNTEPQSYWFDEGRIILLCPGINVVEVRAEEDGGPNSCAPLRY